MTSSAPNIPNGEDKPLDEASLGLHDSKYAEDKRKLMDLINTIRSTGASLDVDLPTIVVAGNQSSGKSSLIEAISGIKLPRAGGTCTRVPIEVRLRQEAKKQWKCLVKIRREVDEHGQDIVNGQKPEVNFGPPIRKLDLVEATIRRAQLAILNPSVPLQDFVGYPLPEEGVDVPLPLGSTKQLAFSRNVIVLEISGPNVTDLTLVDLPGIIQSIGKGEDKNNIQLVENLVKDYIRKECLILLVITMKDDPQNQKAVLLANDVDPQGKRTIGVLTKVDTLRGRDIDPWVKVLTDDASSSLHGYFVTRQPNADELAEQISFEEARAREVAFFRDTKPWNTLALEYANRLGTSKLTTYLSDQLSGFIREKLPDLVAKIHKRYEKITDELEALGKEPSNDPSSEMMVLVTDFTAILEAKIMGSPGHEAFMQAVKAAFEGYKREVWATAPRFTPLNSRQIGKTVPAIASTASPAADQSPLISRPVINKAFDLATIPPFSFGVNQQGSTPSTSSGVASFATTAPALAFGSSSVNTTRGTLAETDGGFVCEIEEIKDSALGPNGAKGEVMNVDDVREFIKNSLTRELPNNVPFAAKAQLIRRFTSSWGDLAKKLLSAVRPLIENLLKEAIERLFKQYHHGKLPAKVNAIVKDRIRHLVDEAQAQIVKLTALDDRPFTMNDHYLTDVRVKLLAHLKEKRFPKGLVLDQAGHDDTVRTVLSGLNKIGIAGLKEDDLAKLRSTDEYEIELEVMAEIRAYWQVAYKRIIDNVPRIIDAEFIFPAAQQIRNALLKELHIFAPDGPARCRALLAESPADTKLREKLRQRRERLGHAQDAIKNLELA